MKQLISKLLVGVLFFAFVFSCSSDDDGGTRTITPLIVSVNGQSFLPTAIPSAQMSNSNRYIIISATNSNTSEILTIAIGTSSGDAADLAVGTYNIDGTTDTTISFFDGTNTYITNNNGQVVITDLNLTTREISGTFEGLATGSFGATETYNLTNGEFNEVSFSIQ